MAKVKSFFQNCGFKLLDDDLKVLDKAVNYFIEQNNIEKIISVSDSTTVGADGQTETLIRVVAYE